MRQKGDLLEHPPVVVMIFRKLHSWTHKQTHFWRARAHTHTHTHTQLRDLILSAYNTYAGYSVQLHNLSGFPFITICKVSGGSPPATADTPSSSAISAAALSSTLQERHDVGAV